MSCGRRRKRTFTISLLLVAVALRMLIPPGFMPASGRPFLMEICREGLPADLLATVGAGADSMAASIDMDSMDMDAMDMDAMGMDAASMGKSTPHPGTSTGATHHGTPSQSDHCVFGTACGAGPIPYVPPASALHPRHPFREVAFTSSATPVRAVHLPQPRAPPSRLS